MMIANGRHDRGSATAVGVDLFGLEGSTVRVRAEVSCDAPGFELEGFSEHARREVSARVKSAIAALGLALGVELSKRAVTVTFSPHVPIPHGFDLPIAVAILGALGIVPPESVAEVALIGNLGFSGDLHSTRGVLPRVRHARDRAAIAHAVVPSWNALEGAAVDGIEVRTARTLAAVVADLQKGGVLENARRALTSDDEACDAHVSDMADIPAAWMRQRRALEIAAVGGHHLLLVGESGAPRLFLSRCLLGILPTLSSEDALEVMAMQSVSGRTPSADRPLRVPHHSVSEGGLIGSGGGSAGVYVGEVSLADRGVLLLDDLPDFRRPVLDALGRAVSDGAVTLRSGGRATTLPSSPMLVGAMAPCACGKLWDPGGQCRCTADSVAKYWGRIPFVARLDLRVTLPRLDPFGRRDGESSAVVASRVAAARAFRGARLASASSTALAQTDEEAAVMSAMVKFHDLPKLATFRVVSLARTIADIAASNRITREHVEEAVKLTRLPRALEGAKP